ncbi:MAG: holo-ACP synthase [Dissulfurispiraceae bacterium]
MLGLGTDIVETSRVEHWVDDDDMLSLVYTMSERKEARNKKYPHKYLAAAFAVKEAFMKALGTGWGAGVQWKDIEMSDEGNGRSVRLYNKAKELCGDRAVLVSTGCSRSLVVAVVTIE